MADLVRVRATTVYAIEARLDAGRPWKAITSGVEWPPYADKTKATKVAKELKQSITRSRVK